MKCAIIGSGSSAKDFDFTRLKDIDTIAVNRAYSLCDSKYLVFLDRAMFTLHEEDIRNYKGEIYCHERAVPKDFKCNTFQTSFNTPARKWGDSVLGQLSGLAALNIAILQGYTEIYLIGFDMHTGHLFDESPIYSDDKTMSKLINKFALFNDFPVKIYNCNENSSINCFEYSTAIL